MLKSKWEIFKLFWQNKQTCKIWILQPRQVLAILSVEKLLGFLSKAPERRQVPLWQLCLLVPPLLRCISDPLAETNDKVHLQGKTPRHFQLPWKTKDVLFTSLKHKIILFSLVVYYVWDFCLFVCYQLQTYLYRGK